MSTTTTTDRVAEEAQRLAEQEKAAEERRAEVHARDLRQRREQAAKHAQQNRERQEAEAAERQCREVAQAAAYEATRAAEGAGIAIENFERRHAERRDVADRKATEAIERRQARAVQVRDELASEWCATPSAPARLPDQVVMAYVSTLPGFAEWLAAAELTRPSSLNTEQVQARRKAALAHEAVAKAAAERAAVAARLDGPEHASQAMDARDEAVRATGKVKAALDGEEA